MHVFSFLFLIIIIIIIITTTFTQDIYNYTPETRNVSTVCNVAAVLGLQFVLHVMLFRSCTFALAFPAVCVQCPIWLFFCSSLISCFPVLLLRYCLSDFGIIIIIIIIIIAAAAVVVAVVAVVVVVVV